MRGESVYRAGAESRAQPLDQMLPLTRRLALLEREAEVVTGERHHVVGSQRDFPHRLGKREIGEPLAQEEREMPGVAGRRDQADRDFGGGPFAGPVPEDQGLHAARTCGEEAAGPDEYPPRRQEERPHPWSRSG